jgi:hypothetical protein
MDISSINLLHDFKPNKIEFMEIILLNKHKELIIKLLNAIIYKSLKFTYKIISLISTCNKKLISSF